MTPTVALTGVQQARLHELTAAAVMNVSRGLTQMFSADVVVTALRIETVPLHEVITMVGDPEMEVAGIYLMAEGDVSGHLLLLMRIPSAMELCDILLESPPGATQELGEMEISALGEVGNIVGSFFLNSMADSSGLRLQVSPPVVACDMAGALISAALTDVAMYADEALVIDANFEHRGRRLPAWFLAFPDPTMLPAMLGTGGGA